MRSEGNRVGFVPVSDAAKRLLLGRAQRSDSLHEALLPKRIALPVFASDALSSNGYATQEILLVLAAGGAAMLSMGLWVAALVILVFFTVVISYRQVVQAYPSGGGDYEVVSTNLGSKWGVVVASALLIDYVLTVAVSISSAVANIASTWSFIGEHSTWWAVAIIIVVAILNLRGMRESGAFFAIPVYAFMVSILGMIAFAIFRIALGHDIVAATADWVIIPEVSVAGLGLIFLLARAFSSGTTALTGIEAIANGVPAFRKPKSKNAAATLLILGVIATTMFGGITWLAVHSGVKITEFNDQVQGLPEDYQQKTVIVQIAEATFTNFPIGVAIVTITTALILALAANTAFNGFPVMGSVLAKDGYLPRQLHTRGDRLAYSNGIIALAVLAIILVVIYQANVTNLIQLYILGVFVSFTMSQIGMVRHWNRLLREQPESIERGRWKRTKLINAFGACMTASVLVIVLLTKFTHGAYIVVIAIPVIWFIMQSIHRHYERVARELRTTEDDKMTLPSRVHSIVLVSKIHKPTLRALEYARATRPTVLEAVTVDVDEEDTAALAAEWERRNIPVSLKILASPYREITRPILDYVKTLRTDSPRDLVTVYVPEYVVGHWWEHLLHNQSALRLKSRLLFTPGVMVVSVPWQLRSSERLAAEDETVRWKR